MVVTGEAIDCDLRGHISINITPCGPGQEGGKPHMLPRKVHTSRGCIGDIFNQSKYHRPEMGHSAAGWLTPFLVYGLMMLHIYGTRRISVL